MSTKSKTSKVRSNANGVKNGKNGSKNGSKNGKNGSKTAAKPFKETTNPNNEQVTSSSYSDWDKAVEAQAEKWRQQGKEVFYARDSNGALHATTLGKDRAKEIANSYDTGESSSYNIGGKTYNVQTAAQQQAALDEAYNNGYSSGTAAVNDAMAQYNNIYSTQQADVTAALKNAYAANAEQINTNYDNAARNYYQLYKTQQAQLPENLSKLGVTGGASESAQIDLLNTYSNNLYNNESNRNNQLANANQNYNDKIAENSANVANSIASAYLQMAQQQLQYQREDEQAAAEKQAAAEETAAAQAVEKWNTNVRNRIAEQIAKGDTIWTWTDGNGKLHWSTYQSVGLANGGKELSGSNYKKKIVSDSSSSNNTKYYKVKDDQGDEPKTSGKVTGYGAYQVSDEYYNKVLKNAKALALTPMTQERAVDYVVNDSGLPEWHQKKILTEIGLL